MFTWDISTQFAQEYTTYAITIFSAYIPCVYGIQYLMKHRDPFQLDKPLMIWNSLLSISSFIGFCFIMNDSWTMSFTERILDLGTITSGTSGIVIFLFDLSKIPELFDTLFIVFRKKPLLFLHTYHHLATGIYAWITLLYPISLGLWLTTINLGVHSIMYGYYACNYYYIRIINPKYITSIQILQMIWGIFINFMYIYHTKKMTHVDIFHSTYTITMFSSYTYLFCKFYKTRYIKNYIKKK